MYGKGISREGSVLDIAVDQGIAKNRGLVHLRGRAARARSGERQAVPDRQPRVMVEISEKVRQFMGLGDKEPEVESGNGFGADDDAPISLDD